MRTSFTVGTKEWKFFISLADKIKVNRDPLLAKRLESEIDFLGALDKNDPKDAKLISQSVNWIIMDKQKVSVILPSGVISRMNALCKDKNIQRSMFFHHFIEVQNISCFYSTLMLSNPRRALKRPYHEWLGLAGKRCPSISEFAEFYSKRVRECMETGYLGLDDDAPSVFLNEYLENFYVKRLNMSKDDSRRNAENQMDISQEDFNNLTMEELFGDKK